MKFSTQFPGACRPDINPVSAGDRCTGECCRAFPLPWNHDKLGDWLRGEALPPSIDHAEIHMVLAMTKPEPAIADNWYSCKLFDGHSCTAYDARPTMCSDFPYGRRCEHGKLCSWTEGRRGHHSRAADRRLRLRVLS